MLMWLCLGKHILEFQYCCLYLTRRYNITILFIKINYSKSKANFYAPIIASVIQKSSKGHYNCLGGAKMARRPRIGHPAYDHIHFELKILWFFQPLYIPGILSTSKDVCRTHFDKDIFFPNTSWQYFYSWFNGCYFAF